MKKTKCVHLLLLSDEFPDVKFETDEEAVALDSARAAAAAAATLAARASSSSTCIYHTQCINHYSLIQKNNRKLCNHLSFKSC